MVEKGMDPLMKKIYIGAVVLLMIIICGTWSCISCSGPSKVTTVYKCASQGCPGKQEVTHDEGKTPPPPT